MPLGPEVTYGDFQIVMPVEDENGTLAKDRCSTGMDQVSPSIGRSHFVQARRRHLSLRAEVSAASSRPWDWERLLQWGSACPCMNPARLPVKSLRSDGSFDCERHFGLLRKPAANDDKKAAEGEPRTVFMFLLGRRVGDG